MNNGMSSFSRNLDLLIEDDLSVFFQELARFDYPLPVTSESELNKLIQFGREFFPNSTFAISAGMTPIGERLMAQIRGAIAGKFLSDILPIIRFLYTFRGDNDFISKVKTNLTNPPQFNDTFFELRCLNHFHKNGFIFQYEPKVFDGKKEKNPDFRLTKDDIELFCECKQVRSGQNIAALKFGEQCAYVESKFRKNLQRQLADAKLRLEIGLKRSPSQPDLDELARQVNSLSSETRGIRELPLQQIRNRIEYLVIPQSEPSPFPVKTLRTISLQVSRGKPFRIGNPINAPGGEISIISTDLTRREAETLRDTIREAKNQLPDDKPCIMIINRARLILAGQAIARRMNLRQYDNIIAFAINPFDDFWPCYRTGYRKLLFDLFEGFQSENPFKSD